MMAHEDGPGRPRHERGRRRAASGGAAATASASSASAWAAGWRSCWPRSGPTPWPPWCPVTGSSRGPTRSPTTRALGGRARATTPAKTTSSPRRPPRRSGEQLRAPGQGGRDHRLSRHRPRLLQRHPARGLRRRGGGGALGAQPGLLPRQHLALSLGERPTLSAGRGIGFVTIGPCPLAPVTCPAAPASPPPGPTRSSWPRRPRSRPT